VGYSDGGNVALLVALQRPDLVRSLVLIGANYHADGVVPGLFEEFDADSELVQNLMLAYGERSPDGAEHFPVIIEKESAMIDREPSLTPDDLRRIAVPALVLVGDDDAVLLTHTLSLYESLPLGQLAVIPGASHLVPFEKPELVAQLVIDFLRTGGATATMMPVRRAQHARTPS
jgi:pimeloyl-ACP methyl ester carboxylesterase